MAKWSNDANMDAMLNNIKTTALRICVCSAQPTTWAEATTTHDGGASKYCLAIKTIASTDFTGPADGDVSGRKLTVNEAAGIEVLATASATHIALADADDTLIYVTTCTSQALTDGNTVTVPAFDIEVADAA